MSVYLIDYFMIFLFIIGLILVTYELSIRTVKCPANKVIYKYVTINDLEVNNPLDDVITNIFKKPSPWVGKIENKKKD
jgi:hypothetical protein